MEARMNMRSLTPFRSNGNLARPDYGIFGTLHREVDRLFDEFSRGFGTLANPATNNLVPSINVSETDKQIEITAEMPGLERKDVEVALEDNILTIRGEKKMEDEKTDEKKNHHVVERNYGLFLRMLELPPGIDPSSVQATMSNGVLKIVIPKPAQAEAKKIEVKDAA
jgi:HSP20 family protein